MGVRGQLSGLPPPLIGSHDTILGGQSSDVGAAGWTLPSRRAASPYRTPTRNSRLISWPLTDSAPYTMGCTSSAPTMASTNSNTTEKNVEIGEEKHDESMKEVDETMRAVEDSGTNEIKVLPSCDTLAEHIQLDSNNKCMVDTYNLDLDKEIPTNTEEQMDVKNMPKEDRTSPIIEQAEEKLSSLEEVVDKVVKLHVAETEISCADVPKQELKLETVSEKISDNVKSDDTVFTLSNDILEIEVEPGELEHEIEQAKSPTQSTSSRATRWEALADIAAELPPSLAVDPLTGQIYALTK